jgi:glycosyltransferase involved in cell wall biosynthesis
LRVALVSPLDESVPPHLYWGTERVVHALATGLDAAGIETTVFTSGDSRVPGKLVAVVPEPLGLGRHPVEDPVYAHSRLLAEVARRAPEFDLIHNHHDVWMLPLTGMTSTPVLTTLHGRLDLPGLGDTLRA